MRRLAVALALVAAARGFVAGPAPARASGVGRCAAAPAGVPPPPLPKYCSECGAAAMELRVPEGDERLRACCSACGRIEYVNPKIVVACVVITDDNRTLLAKRDIEPRRGTWGFPQGYMENGESPREGAVREALEETGVVLAPEGLRLRAVYNVLPEHVQLVYEARVLAGDLEPLAASTLESSEIALFPRDALPSKNDICFETVTWALDHCLQRGAAHVQQRTKFFDADAGEWRLVDEDVG